MKLLAFLNLDWQILDLHIILCTFLYFETFSTHKVLKTLYKHGCLYKPEILKLLLINFKKSFYCNWDKLGNTVNYSVLGLLFWPH